MGAPRDRGGAPATLLIRRGEDIGGIGVHIAARVMAAAEPGEVLVSRTVRDLVVGAEFRFEDRGAHALKGVEGDRELFALADARLTGRTAAESIP